MKFCRGGGGGHVECQLAIEVGSEAHHGVSGPHQARLVLRQSEPLSAGGHRALQPA